MVECGAEAVRGDDAGKQWPVTDVARFLVGEWSLSRSLVDDGGGSAGSFEGRAHVWDDGAVLVYREWGELRLGQHRGSASRCLHYQVTGPGQARVFFDYGVFFHDLDLRSGRGTAWHPCRADVYRGEFVVLGPDLWWQRWDVSGPEKNQVITTWLTRTR